MLSVVNLNNQQYGATNYLESQYFYRWNIKVPTADIKNTRYPVYTENARLYETVADIDNDGIEDRILSIPRSFNGRYLAVLPASYEKAPYLVPGELAPVDYRFTSEFRSFLQSEIANGYVVSIEEPAFMVRMRDEAQNFRTRFEGRWADYFIGKFNGKNYVAFERPFYFPNGNRSEELNRYFLLDIQRGGDYQEICVLKRTEAQGD